MITLVTINPNRLRITPPPPTMLEPGEADRQLSSVKKWLLRFAVFGVEMQADLTARPLFGRVDNAGIKWTGVNVKADGSLIELARVQYSMDRIGGIDGARMGDVHLDSIQRLQAARPATNVLMHQVEILNL